MKKIFPAFFTFLLVIQIQSIAGITQSDDNSLITDFSTNVLLSIDDSIYGHHVEPTLAISGNGTLFAGWKEAYDHNSGGVRVSFTRSDDNGLTWLKKPVNMPNFISNTGQSDPWLVWHDESETLYYAYLEYSLIDNGGNFTQITVAKSNDYGRTWIPITATQGNGFADKETMAISTNGTVYVAYDDLNMTSDVTTVRLSRSDDGGNTFNETSVITDSITHPDDHVGPYVITNSNNDVYVAWFWFTNGSWGDIYVVSSKNQGDTFSAAVDVNDDGENATFTSTPDRRPAKGSLPVIHFDQNDRLYVLWSEKHEPEGEWDVYIRYSDDHGQTWSQRYRVNPVIEDNQWMPDFDIDSKGRCHIVYYDERGDTFKPYYRMLVFPENSTEDVVYGDPVAIADKVTSNGFTRPGDYFTIRVDSEDIPHVVWTDGRENEMDIYYSHGIPKSVTAPASIDIFFPLALAVLFTAKKRKEK